MTQQVCNLFQLNPCGEKCVYTPHGPVRRWSVCSPGVSPVIPVFWLTPQVALGDKTEVINASQQSLGVSLSCQF